LDFSLRKRTLYPLSYRRKDLSTVAQHKKPLVFWVWASLQKVF